jgi:signal transduction histidine kinase
LGLVYNELKEYERAADCHLKALATVKEFNLQSEEHQEAVCYNNLGYLYIKQKDYKKAGENFELGLKDKTILDDDPELYSSLIDNLAYCRMQLNDDNQLPKLFFDALEVRKKLDNYTVVVGSYIHLSEFYQKKKDNLSAIRFSDEALRVARESKIPINIILALKQASVVDDKNSVKYSSDYVRISDSLQIEERNSKDRFARIQLETDELRQENFNLEEKNRNILNYFFGTVVFIGVLFFIRTQRSRARLLALKQAQQQANEEIYRLIISHQNQLELGKDLEKKRLSKELHDGVLGRLFGLRLSLDGLNSFDDEQAKKERLEYLNELQLIEQDLREISHELNRETSLLINNFVAIINSLIEQQAKVNNANIKVVIGKNIDWDKISNIIKINLYRILQEALQNINKHAGAKNVLVHFRKDTEENLLFNIEDDGKGFDTNIKKNKGIGTKNMVSRVHQCNGSIDIKSEIGKGSKIIIIFPLENSNFKV